MKLKVVWKQCQCFSPLDHVVRPLPMLCSISLYFSSNSLLRSRTNPFSSVPDLTHWMSVNNHSVQDPLFVSAPMNVSRSGPGPFTCQDCGRTYQQYASLWRHRNYECGKSPQFRCPYCTHSSKRKSNLNKHIRIIHSGEDANTVAGNNRT